MGRHRSYSQQVEARVGELARAGESVASIRQQLSAEGLKLPGARTVGAIAARAKAAAAGGEAGKAAASKGGPAIVVGDATVLVSSLRGAVATMERVVEQVDLKQADPGDVRLLNSTFRTLAAVVAQIERMTPPEPPNLEANPDVIAGAAEGRAKLWGYVERALAGKA